MLSILSYIILKSLSWSILVLSSNFVFNFYLQGGKKNGARKMKKMNDLVSEPEYAVTMGPDFPADLKKLWLWASDSLKDGRSHTFQLSEEAFGSG